MSMITEATLLTRRSRYTSKSIRSLGLKKLDDRPTFTSAFGFVMASLGCMVGSGNIWRFPKAAAVNSDGEGCLVFILIWLLFLFLWSIPMVILEYGIGRHTQVTLIKSFKRMMGDNFIWGGIWISVVTFLVACYYAVIVGWCLYYSCVFIAQPPPGNYTESSEIFNTFVKDSGWSYVTLAVTVLLTGLICLGGISSVEKVTMVIVPVTFIILLVAFIYTMTRHEAVEGLKFLFTPHWGSFLNVQVWGNAALHNLLCVSAGMGLLLTYSIFLNEDNGVVRYGVLITSGNTVISLLVAMMIFGLVFSSYPTWSRQALANILAADEPGGTGVTFIWLPIIFGSLGFAGRLLCIVFFLSLYLLGLATIVACIFVGVRNLHDAFLVFMSGDGAMGQAMLTLIYLSLALLGLATSIAMMEMGTQQVIDVSRKKVPRPVAIFLLMNLMFCVGLGSIMSPDFLRCQDNIWNSGLIISALLLVIMAVTYGITKLREKGINDKSIDDWNLPVVWEWTIRYVCPIEIILILVWWFYDVISRSLVKGGHHWYDITADNILTYVIAWVALLIVSLFINLIVVCCKPRWFMSLEDDLWEEDEFIEGFYDGADSLMGDAPPTAAPGVYDMPNRGYGALDEVDDIPPAEYEAPPPAPVKPAPANPFAEAAVPPPEEPKETTPLKADG